MTAIATSGVKWINTLEGGLCMPGMTAIPTSGSHGTILWAVGNVGPV